MLKLPYLKAKLLKSDLSPLIYICRQLLWIYVSSSSTNIMKMHSRRYLQICNLFTVIQYQCLYVTALLCKYPVGAANMKYKSILNIFGTWNMNSRYALYSYKHSNNNIIIFLKRLQQSWGQKCCHSHMLHNYNNKLQQLSVFQ